MNVLLLVSIMLVLMNVMTYTRLQTYLDTAGVRIEYEQYMTMEERRQINILETTKYAFTKVKSIEQPKEGEANPDKQVQETAYSFLNIYPIFASILKAGDKNSQPDTTRTDAITKLFKRMLEKAYGNQRFYKEALKKYPELLDDLVKQMQESIPNATIALKLTSRKDLANIPMLDDDMREVLYKMLKGQESSKTVVNGKKVITNAGYPALRTLITLKSKPSTLRVWLARAPLIEAIFRDPEPFFERRSELYRQIKAGVIKPEGATKDLSGLFKNVAATDIDLSLLDFTASTTPPPDLRRDKFSNPSEEQPEEEEDPLQDVDIP